MFDSPQSLQR